MGNVVRVLFVLVTPIDFTHRLGKCICVQGSGHFDFENVAVDYILVTSTLKLLLWLVLCVFYTFQKPFVLMIATPNHHDLEHVLVAGVLETSSLKMLLWLLTVSNFQCFAMNVNVRMEVCMISPTYCKFISVSSPPCPKS